MKRIAILSMVLLSLCSIVTIQAQKAPVGDEELNGKITTFDENGNIQMVINKDMVERFKDVEVDENYMSWNMIYSRYDWPTVSRLMADYKNGLLDITNKTEVEARVAEYQAEIKTSVYKKPLPNAGGNLTINDNTP